MRRGLRRLQLLGSAPRCFFALAVVCGGGCSDAQVPLEPAGPPACHVAGCITTVIGTGKADLDEHEGTLGWQSPTYAPQDLTTGPDGKLYFIDWNNHRIRSWDPAAERTYTVAGTGQLGDFGHGGNPLSARLNHPSGLAFDGKGRLLVAAWHNGKIKRIDFAANRIDDICGTGARAFAGDGGPANKARLDLPSSVAPMPAGGSGSLTRPTTGFGVSTSTATCARSLATCG